MPYGMTGSNYAAGDYYQGDGFFSAIGRGLKVAGAAVLGGGVGFLKGGPLGAAKGAAGAVIATAPMVVSKGIQDETLAAGSNPSVDAANMAISKMRREMAAMAAGAPMISAPPAPGGMPVLMLPPMAGGRTPRLPGTNKSTYAVRGGGTSRWGPATGQVMIIPRGTVMVKSRRMNPANPRALRRGLRRAAGFVKLARRAQVRLSAFTGRGKKKK